MTTKASRFFSLLLLIAAALSTRADVINGDFEQGMLGWTTNGPGTDISPWIAGSDSAHSVEIGGGNISGNILSQKISITPDSIYGLKFDWLALGDIGRTGVLRVDILNNVGAPLASQTFSENAQHYAPFTFGHRLLPFRVPSDVTEITIAFVDLSPFGGVAVDPCVDKVEVIALADPSIITQPSSLAVWSGNSANFSVGVFGSEPLSYQWRFNGSDLSGATLSTLTLANTAITDDGNYSVVVSNSNGFATSIDAHLTVLDSSGPNAGMVSWWRAEGNANDSVGTNNGTLLNGTAFAAGRVGQAFNLDGSDDAITFGASAGNFRTNDFTVVYWVRMVNTGGAFLEKRPACNMDYGSAWWNIRGTSTASLEIAGARQQYYTGLATKTALNDGLWHHVAWTRQGTSLCVYVDGALDNSVTAPGIADVVNSTALALGRSACYDSAPFRGGVDELQIYERALSATEISARYDEASSGPPQIVVQPTDRSVLEGSTTTFTVGVVGSQPMSFQWLFEGAPIAGATGSSLTVGPLTFENTGSYSAIVSNALGVATSSTAVLTVRPGSSFPSGLVAWWPADDDATDAVGDNDGTLYGAATFMAGKIGSAFQFDGGASHVDFGTSMGNFGTNDFSIGCWMKPMSSGGGFLEKRPACNMDWGSGWWGIRGIWTFNLEIAGPRNQYYAGVETRTALNDGNWHHVMWTRKANTLSVYVDGALDNRTTTLGIADVSNIAPMELGLSSCDYVDGTLPGKGGADELQIYGRALTPDEVSSVYNANGSTSSELAPRIVLQPRNQRRNQGNSATFKITAVGAHPLLYQWQLGGVTIPGATEETLVYTDLTQTNGFRCIVRNGYGSTISTTAYILQDTAAGVYNGLYYEEDAIRNESSGLVNLTIGKKGVFSGNVWVDGRRRPFKGQLVNFQADVTILLTNDTVNIHLQSRNTNDCDEVVGTISNNSWTASLHANYAPFSRKNPAPQSGKYTVALNDDVSEGGPKGASFGALTVSPDGAVKLASLFADDGHASFGSRLSARGEWPLYIPLYKGTGSVLGWLTFTNTDSSSVEGWVSWIKTGAFGKYFPAGFTNAGLLVGSSYAAPTNRAPINVTNAIVTLEGDGLTVSNNVRLTATNAVTVGQTNYQILTIDPRSGLFKGTIVNGLTKVAVRGALLQQTTNGVGYFVRTNVNGDVVIRGRQQ